MKYIKILDIDFPLFDGNLGISISGGTDSSLLLYLLMNHISPDQTLHILMFGKGPEHYSSLAHSRTVLRIVSRLTNNTNYIEHVDYNIAADRRALYNNASILLANKTIDYLYTGITENPPEEVINEFGVDSTEGGLRGAGIKKNIMYSDNICTPFSSFNKRDISKLYNEFGLMDNLFPFTISCTSSKIEHIGTHCGECWWCHERLWGFGKFN